MWLTGLLSPRASCQVVGTVAELLWGGQHLIALFSLFREFFSCVLTLCQALTLLPHHQVGSE